MKSFRSLIGASLVTLAALAPAAAQDFTEVWRKGGFATPESVSYDPASRTLFVSNINSPDRTANGQGYISQLSLEGEVLDEKFVEGLNAPKGTQIAGGKLYVAGMEELVEADLATSEVLQRYPAPGAGFLNDVAVAEDGTVYVSETMQGAIYRLSEGTLGEWLTDPALAGANGLALRDGKLLVATLGDISGGFDKMKPSNVKSVDLATKEISDFGSSEPVGGLDGIETAEGGVTVTDNSGGRLVFVGENGTVREIAATGRGSADHEVVAGENLVVIPFLRSNEVAAFRMAP